MWDEEFNTSYKAWRVRTQWQCKRTHNMNNMKKYGTQILQKNINLKKMMMWEKNITTTIWRITHTQ
jgi:hypothetical protein